MILKSLFAAAAVASTMALVAPAEAGVKVYLGGGFYDNGHGYDGYPDYQPEQFYEAPRRHKYRGISCEDGAEQVREEGFRKVRVIECEGKHYTYKARRHGGRYVVTVSRRHGEVVSVEQVY